jgi:hypothetical protein
MTQIGRQPQFVLQMEDNLNFFTDGRRPQFFRKWNNFLEIGIKFNR